MRIAEAWRILDSQLSTPGLRSFAIEVAEILRFRAGIEVAIVHSDLLPEQTDSDLIQDMLGAAYMAARQMDQGRQQTAESFARIVNALL